MQQRDCGSAARSRRTAAPARSRSSPIAAAATALASAFMIGTRSSLSGRRGEKTIGDPKGKSHDRRLRIDAGRAWQDAAVGDQDIVGGAQAARRDRPGNSAALPPIGQLPNRWMRHQCRAPSAAGGAAAGVASASASVQPGWPWIEGMTRLAPAASRPRPAAPALAEAAPVALGQAIVTRSARQARERRGCGPTPSGRIMA